MRRFPALVLVGVTLMLGACGASSHDSGVPTLSASNGNATDSGSRPSTSALHAAAQCIRDHGIPAYQDPAVGPDFTIYADQRSLEKASDAAVQQARTQCSALIAAAHFDPARRPHPPAQMVRDGVREAQCFRAHGLPNWPDPKPTDTFDPGHGFQVDISAFAGAVAPGQNPKQSRAFQQAIHACMTQSEAVSADSQLSNLAHGR